MSKKKNMKIFILSLTLCLSTLSIYNANAMEFKKIEINTPKEDKRETVKLSKKNIKTYKKTIMGYIDKIENNCRKEYGIEYVKKNFNENYKILKNQLNCLKNNKIDTDELILKLQEFKILNIDSNKKYKFPDEDTENNTISLLNYVKNFLEQKKEELSDYLNNKNNKKQIEITKDIVESYINEIINFKKEFNEQKDQNFLIDLLQLIGITSNGKLNFERFILILSNLKNDINDPNSTLYYLKPETKEYLESFLDKEKKFLDEQSDYFFLTEEIILEYIKKMHNSLNLFIEEFMQSMQEKYLSIERLANLKEKVEAFFCFDEEKLDCNMFLDNLKNEEKYKNKKHTVITDIGITTLKSSINKTKNILEKIDSQIKNMSKVIGKGNRKQKKLDLVEILISLYLNGYLKSKINLYEYTINTFLNYYKTNEVVNEELKNIFNDQKSKILNYICLNNEKKLDKEKFLENLKHCAEILNEQITYYKQIDIDTIDFKIPEYYKEKLEKHFIEAQNDINNLNNKFQTKYENITEEIKNNKNKITNNKNPKKVTPEMLIKLSKKFINEAETKQSRYNTIENKNKRNNYFLDEKDKKIYNRIKEIDTNSEFCIIENKENSKNKLTFNNKRLIEKLKEHNITDSLNYEIDNEIIPFFEKTLLKHFNKKKENEIENNNNSNENSIKITPILSEEELKKTIIENISDTKDKEERLKEIDKILDDNLTEIKDSENTEFLTVEIPKTQNIDSLNNLIELAESLKILTEDSFNLALNNISNVIDNFENEISEYLKDKKNYQKLYKAYTTLKENKFIKTGKNLNIKNFLEEMFNLDYDETKKCIVNSNPNILEINCSDNYIKKMNERIDENNEKLKKCFKQLENNNNIFFETDTNESIKMLLSSLKDNFEYFSNKIKQLINNFGKKNVPNTEFEDLLSRYFMLSNSIFLTPEGKLDEENLIEILNFYDSNIFGEKRLKISKEQKKELENTFRKYKNSSNRLLNILYYIHEKYQDETRNLIEEIDAIKKLKNLFKKNNSLNNFEIIGKIIMKYTNLIHNFCNEIKKMLILNLDVNDLYKNFPDYIYDLEEFICLDENEKLDFEKFKNNIQNLGYMNIEPNIKYTISEKFKNQLEELFKIAKKFLEDHKKLDIKNKNIITTTMVLNFLNTAIFLGNKITDINTQYKKNNKYDKEVLLEHKKIFDEFKTFLCLTEDNEINHFVLTNKLREMGYLEIDKNKPYCQFENPKNIDVLLNTISTIKRSLEETPSNYIIKLEKLEDINNNAPEPNFNINIIPSTKIDSIFNTDKLELYKTFSKKIDNLYTTINDKNNRKNNKKSNIMSNKNELESIKNELESIIKDYMKMYILTFLKDKEKLNEKAIEEINKIIKDDFKINDLKINDGNIAKKYKFILEYNIENFKKKLDEKIKKLLETKKLSETTKYIIRYIKNQIKCRVENLEKEFLNNENKIENKIILNNENNNSINIKNEDIENIEDSEDSENGYFINENYINNENYIGNENEENINKNMLGDAAPILPTNNKNNNTKSKININQNEINNKNNIENINKPVNTTENLKNNFEELQKRFNDIVKNFDKFFADYHDLKDSLIKSELTDILNKDSITKFNSIYNKFLSENREITKKQNEKRTQKEQEEKRKEKEEKNKKKNNK